MSLQPVSDADKGKDSQFGIFVFILTVLMVFIVAARTPLDSDMWWHLRAGEDSILSRAPVLTDQYSFTRFGEKWINHSWMAEIILYLAFRWGGTIALGGITALLAALSMGLILYIMDGPPILSAFILLLGTLVSAVVWAPRPQLFSFLFLAMMQLVLFQFKWKKRKILWPIPILFLVWSNLHGGYALGLILVIAMVCGEILNHILGHDGVEVLTWKEIRGLVIWGLISILALLVNPNGLDTWLVPFRTVGVSVLQNFVSEWASPDFHQLFQQPFIWLLLAVLAVIGLDRKRIDGSDLVTLCVFTYMALLARRNFGPFGLIVPLILARYLSHLVQNPQPSTFIRNIGGFFRRLKIILEIRKRERNQELESSPKFRSKEIPSGVKKGINLCFVIVFFVVAIMKVYITANPILVDSYMNRTYPVKAIDWIRLNQPNGPMLSEYNWGGFLIWNLRQYPVFVDGRTDLYGDKVLGEWIQVVQAGAGWEDILNKWNVNLIMVEPGRPLVNRMPVNGWNVRYQDDQAVILGR